MNEQHSVSDKKGRKIHEGPRLNVVSKKPETDRDPQVKVEGGFLPNRSVESSPIDLRQAKFETQKRVTDVALVVFALWNIAALAALTLLMILIFVNKETADSIKEVIDQARGYYFLSVGSSAFVIGVAQISKLKRIHLFG